MRPTSFLTQKTVEMLDDSVLELGGLNEVGVKALHFFLIHILGIKNYKINVKYQQDPKEIVIRVFDSSGKQVYMKLKGQEEILSALAVRIGVPNYKIRFAERSDVD